MDNLQSSLTHYKKNEQVYLEKEPAHHFYYLKSGRVQIYVTSLSDTDKMEHPLQALSMIETLAKTVRNLSTQIHEISFLPANNRIARFLLTESSFGQKEIRYTHDKIESLVGCSRITVSRALAASRKQGLLQTQYGRIAVRDAQNLELHSTQAPPS